MNTKKIKEHLKKELKFYMQLQTTSSYQNKYNKTYNKGRIEFITQLNKFIKGK